MAGSSRTNINTHEPIIVDGIKAFDLSLKKNWLRKYVLLKDEPIETIDVEKLLNRSWISGIAAFAPLENEFQYLVACYVCDKYFDLEKENIFSSNRYAELSKVDFLYNTEIKGCKQNAAFIIAGTEKMMGPQSIKPIEELAGLCENLRECDAGELLQLQCLKARHDEQWTLTFEKLEYKAADYARSHMDEIRSSELYKDLHEMYFYGVPKIKNNCWMKPVCGIDVSGTQGSQKLSDYVARKICAESNLCKDAPDVRKAMEALENYNEMKMRYNENIKKELSEIDTEKTSEKEIEKRVKSIISEAEKYKPFLTNDTKELFEEMKLSMKEERTKRYVEHFDNEEELEIGNR